MMREAVDFNLVPERQLAIHARLSDDWRAYCHGGVGSSVAPMFRQYRSSEVYEAASTKPHGDPVAGAKLNAAIIALPGDKYRLALQWAYITEGPPTKARKQIGCTLAGLYKLICDARTMLINRRV